MTASWRAALLFAGFALAISLPLLAVLITGFSALSDLSALAFMAGSVLPGYLLNTALLCLGSAAVALFLGLPTAWFTTQYRFWGRRVAAWLAILPLALPAYVMAYAYTDALDYSGWVSVLLREQLQWLGLMPVRPGRLPWFEIRSLPGACLILGTALSPYITLMARTAFEERQASLVEAARTLGLDGRAVFYRVALPMIRPALAAGLALVLMECLADYGTVAFFSVQTLATGLFKTWFSYGDRSGAAFMGVILLVMAVVLLLAEQRARGRASYVQQGGRAGQPTTLSGWSGLWVLLVCSLPGLLGFVLPVALLVKAAASSPWSATLPTLLQQSLQSLVYGLWAVLMILPMALAMAYFMRSASGSVGNGRGLVRLPWQQPLLRMASSGYAVPGLVVAVGLLVASAAFTRVADWLFDWRITLTSTAALVLGGYLTRFFTVGFSSIESGLGRISKSLDWSARSLGLSQRRLLRTVHLPLLRPSLWVAALLVFVDVVKELPITLVLRPANVETLAVAAYQLAADERLGEAAWPALIIVLTGLLPVLLVGPGGARHRPGPGSRPPASPRPGPADGADRSAA